MVIAAVAGLAIAGLEIGTTTAITASSTPIYDTSFSNIGAWGCEEWWAWHRALDAAFGTRQANRIWLAAWQDERNECWYLGQIICPDTQYCRYNCDFMRYLYSKDIDVSSLFSTVYCSFDGVIKNITEAATTTTEVVKKAVPFLLAGVGVLAVLALKKKKII